MALSAASRVCTVGVVAGDDEADGKVFSTTGFSCVGELREIFVTGLSDVGEFREIFVS